MIAQCSRVLARDVNGSMREAEKKVIEIKDIDGDVDDDIILRFLEYIYSGDYIVLEPDVLSSSNDIVNYSPNPNPAPVSHWIPIRRELWNN